MIGVVGGGQLGRMLALAGLRLGERFCFLDPSPDACAGHVGELVEGGFDDPAALDRLASRSDLVTFEFENVPSRSLQRLAARAPVYPPPEALDVAQDRLSEKLLFSKLGVPVAPFAAVDSRAQLLDALDDIGLPALAKTRREGYDGKGQRRIDERNDAERAWGDLGGVPLLVEKVVDFDRELSVIAVRDREGQIAFYPLVENHHSGGILRLSLTPAPHVDDDQRERAEAYARAILEALDYVGVMTLELFEADGTLYANEIAPRVHNSGHATIEGSVTSQFENHLRAGLGLPLGSTQPVGAAAMLNLIGELPDLRNVLTMPDAHIHLYDKEPRPGRKLGHITIVRKDLASARAALASLRPSSHTS